MSAEEVKGGEVADVSDAMAFIDMVFVLEAEKMYDDITEAYPVAMGKAASKRERDELGLQKTATLVYGELDFKTLGIALQKIQKIYGKPDVGASGPMGALQSRGGQFYDLGSGTGKACIAAACLYPFDMCTGIELLEGLHNISMEASFTYNQKGRNGKGLEPQCQFLRGDFNDFTIKDWRDADVVYANSTCYDDALMEKIAANTRGMKKGTFFISISRRLPSKDFVVLEHELQRMSWGEATVFIHQKTNDPRD